MSETICHKHIQELVFLSGFKKSIKKRKPANCPCRPLNLTYTMLVLYLNYTFKAKSKFYLNLYFIVFHCFIYNFIPELFL